MMRRNSFKLQLIVSLLLCAAGFAKAQTGEEYLQKINANYAGLNSFELVLDYKLYKGHYGEEVKDAYQSTLRMDGKQSHRKLYDDEIITTAETSLILNHQLKTIQVLPGIKNDFFDQNISASLEHCQDVKVKQTEEGTLLTLTFKQYSSIEYARIDVLVDESYWVQHMTLYYANRLNYSTDYFHPDYDYPRLEVDYSNLKKNWKDKTGLTELSNYVLKEGDTYKTAALYQHYEIIQ